MLTAERVRILLDYNPETGVFIWRERPLGAGTEHHDRIWNAKFPGTVAGWDHSGHRAISVDNRKYLAHRLAWLHVHGCWPERDIDHADGDPSNNAITNLRLATMSENLQNSRKRKDNYSGFKGVSLDKRDGRWSAYVHVDGKRLSLGRFDTAEKAHAAYATAAKLHYGEFARIA